MKPFAFIATLVSSVWLLNAVPGCRGCTMPDW